MSFKTLFIREVKAFVKNPAFVASVVITIALYSFIGRLVAMGGEVAYTERMKATACVVVNGEDELLWKTIELTNRTVNVRTLRSNDQSLDECRVVLNIKELSVNVSNNTGLIRLETRIVVEDVNPMLFSARESVASTVYQRLRESLPLAFSLLHNVSTPIDVKVDVSSFTIFKGNVIPASFFSTILSIASLAPFIVGFIMGLTANNAAFMTAVEKDERAFEMLLAQPIPRRSIVLAKITGSIVASLIYGIIIFVSILAMVLFSTRPAGSLGYVGETESTVLASPASILGFFKSIIPVMVYSIIIGMVNAGAIGVIVGSIVNDTRSASVLSTPVMMIYFGLGFTAMFIGLPVSPLTSVAYGFIVLLIPYVYIYSFLTKTTLLFTISLVSSLASSAFLIVLASVLFERDIVVTGLRVKFGRKTVKP